MSVQEQALKLPRPEKLQLMEALWADLSQHDEDLESPAWHGSALAQAEQELESGKATIVGWEDAKRQLRDSK